jgi:hypothetical protein
MMIQAMDSEIWKDVRGWEGKYMISNYGRLKCFFGRYRKSKPEGYITEGCIQPIGYRIVTLRFPGFKYQVRVHTLVAGHFVEKPSLKLNCVNHKDGNKLNNYYKNLEWTTRGDNVRHAALTGLMDFKGVKHKMAKLTNEKVIEMRRLRKQKNMTFDEIGKKFGVCRRQASDVIKGVNWGWLQEGL